MTLNPYEAPAEVEVISEFEPKSVRVKLFNVEVSSFKCRCFTPESLAETLQQEIVTGCRQLGLKESEGPKADVTIVGSIIEVDEGSQLLRYIAPLFAGAAVVRVVGEIRIRGESAQPFSQVTHSRAGFLGGRSETLIRQALSRIGLFVASKAMDRASPDSQFDNQSVIGYFATVGATALIAAVIAAVFGYRWASALPQTNNSIKPGEIPGWACVVAAATSVALVLLATAFAPGKILRSRSMVWLIALSGTRSIAVLRGVLLVFSAIAGAVLFVCFLAAKGS